MARIHQEKALMSIVSSMPSQFHRTSGIRNS
jgi:hypothetical protein